MRLATPVGARSCGSGGHWEWSRAGNGRAHVLHEFESLRRCIVSDVERNALFAELHDRMERAEQGLLQLDSGSGGDVMQMAVAPIVLEIRLPDRHDGDGQRRHVRLYFTEADHVPVELLALKLAWKHPGAIGLEEQNEHALEAKMRAETHYHRPR